jgi:hypothetical protein
LREREGKFGMLAVVKIQQFAYTPEPPHHATGSPQVNVSVILSRVAFEFS